MGRAGEGRAFCRGKLAAYKVPRSIDFERELPRSAAGKLYVRRLRDPYWEGRERRIRALGLHDPKSGIRFSARLE
ncbi:MAG TPA: hypothetical protein VII78_07485 [Myxococcota bacterium]